MVAKSDYGTKMDSVILEALKPQAEEIKNKIASGGSLSHEDIITLTIYTQGNHINHIDMRMDSMDARMNALDEKFNVLNLNFEKLRADIYGKMSEFQASFTKMTAIMSSVCAAAIAIATVITSILK